MLDKRDYLENHVSYIGSATNRHTFNIGIAYRNGKVRIYRLYYKSTDVSNTWELLEELDFSDGDPDLDIFATCQFIDYDNDGYHDAIMVGRNDINDYFGYAFKGFSLNGTFAPTLSPTFLPSISPTLSPSTQPSASPLTR